MSPLPYRIVKRKLLAAGFIETSQRGSHVKFVRAVPEGLRTVIVPSHRVLAGGTLRRILRQAGLSSEEFDALEGRPLRRTNSVLARIRNGALRG